MFMCKCYKSTDRVAQRKVGVAVSYSWLISVSNVSKAQRRLDLTLFCRPNTHPNASLSEDHTRRCWIWKLLLLQQKRSAALYSELLFVSITRAADTPVQVLHYLHFLSKFCVWVCANGALRICYGWIEQFLKVRRRTFSQTKRKLT